VKKAPKGLEEAGAKKKGKPTLLDENKKQTTPTCSQRKGNWMPSRITACKAGAQAGAEQMKKGGIRKKKEHIKKPDKEGSGVG